MNPVDVADAGTIFCEADVASREAPCASRRNQCKVMAERDSKGCVSAVDRDFCTGDERRLIARQKYRKMCHLYRLGNTLDRIGVDDCP
jgi:hypothetical protein